MLLKDTREGGAGLVVLLGELMQDLLTPTIQSFQNFVMISFHSLHMLVMVAFGKGGGTEKYLLHISHLLFQHRLDVHGVL